MPAEDSTGAHCQFAATTHLNVDAQPVNRDGELDDIQRSVTLRRGWGPNDTASTRDDKPVA